MVDGARERDERAEVSLLELMVPPVIAPKKGTNQTHMKGPRGLSSDNDDRVEKIAHPFRLDDPTHVQNAQGFAVRLVGGARLEELAVDAR